MAKTDRQLLKDKESGNLVVAGASDAAGTVKAANCRHVSQLKTGAEAAGVAVGELPICTVERLSKINTAKLGPSTAIANDTTDLVIVKVYKRDAAGANQVQLGIINTHTSADGAVVQYAPKSFRLTATPANALIAAGSILTYDIAKAGAGKVVGPLSTIDLDLEEV